MRLYVTIAAVAALVLGILAAYTHAKLSTIPANPLHRGSHHPPPPAPHHPEPRPAPPHGGWEDYHNATSPVKPTAREPVASLLWRLYTKILALKEAAKSLEEKGLPDAYVALVEEAVKAYNNAVDAAEEGDTRLAYAWAHVANAAANAALRLIHAWLTSTNTTVLPPKITG